MAIKNKSKLSKISEASIKGKTEKECPVHPAFSFRYITNNGSYNFEYFKSNQSAEKKVASEELFSKIIEWSNKTWKELILAGKLTGIETIPFHQINFDPKDIPVSGDEKVYVLRFKAQDYRMLGLKRSPCSTLQVIGFDFDYSAYKHG